MTSIPQNPSTDQFLIPSSGLALGFATTPGTHQATWTQHLGALLNSAEQAYGPRDKRWTILGVEFGGDRPSIFFPPSGEAHVIVRLSQAGMVSPTTAYSELAHEVVHLLSPTGKQDAIVAEEGLATLFSDQRCELVKCPPAPHTPAYEAARDAIAEILSWSPNFVLDARKQRPEFVSWDAEFLHSFFPRAPRRPFEVVCARFQDS